VSVDSASEIFDPEIHAVDKDGNPSFNKDGSFRKKRKDAGKRGAGAAAPTARPASAAGKVLADQREHYKKSVSDFLAVPVTLASLADPVMGFAGSMVAPLWADALADLAMEQPRLAAALEGAGKLGAVGGVVGVGVLTLVQFGHLAGRVPANVAQMVGAKTRPEIEKIMEQRGIQMAAEAAERKRQDAEDAAMAAEIAEQLRAERAGTEHGYAAAV
jgi:hypothetical protein